MNIHMIGIGGIGMSALAQLYLSEGHSVTGSDREASPTTELLEEKGIQVVLKQGVENVPKNAELVVYSDAVWDDNPERMRVKELGIREISYYEALGEASKGRLTVAISGTHGKTTTTAMLADILLDVGKSPTAIVGSIVREFGSNFLGGSPQGPFVVEACEYKDHILKLSPDILVITNLEWDHTDWFPSLEAMQATFKKVVEKVPETGVIIANLSDANVAPVLKVARAKIVDYAIESAPELQMIGEFNKMNARAAKAAAKAIAPELTDGVIDVILESFQGTWRRFQYKGETPEGAFVFDDYAHHPTAIRETLKAAYDAMLSGRKLIVAFHPHLYSRTRDLMEEFAGAFEGADEVVLAPIYAARENPIPGITSEELARRIEKHGVVAKAFSSLGEVEKYLRTVSNFKTNIITMGAGDIYKVADALVSTQKK